MSLVNKPLKLTQDILIQNYKKIHKDYNKIIIERLMSNGRYHIVAIFKNYLIEDDLNEYLKRWYKLKESKPRLKYFFNYYNETSVIFPNYTPLVESKYLYNNVIRKQRVIDLQQEQNEKLLKQKQNKKKSKNNRCNFKEKEKEKEQKVFDSEAYDDILNLSESVMRIVFGINSIEENKNNNKPKKNFFEEIKGIDNDNDNNEPISKLINVIIKAEENQSRKPTLTLTNSSTIKNKFKIVSRSLMMKEQKKSFELTNASTNDTNS